MQTSNAFQTRLAGPCPSSFNRDHVWYPRPPYHDTAVIIYYSQQVSLFPPLNFFTSNVILQSTPQTAGLDTRVCVPLFTSVTLHPSSHLPWTWHAGHTQRFMEKFPSNTWEHKRRNNLEANPSRQKHLIGWRRDKSPTKINPLGWEVHLLKCLPAAVSFFRFN